MAAQAAQLQSLQSKPPDAPQPPGGGAPAAPAVLSAAERETVILHQVTARINRIKYISSLGQFQSQEEICFSHVRTGGHCRHGDQCRYKQFHVPDSIFHHLGNLKFLKLGWNPIGVFVNVFVSTSKVLQLV